MEEYLSKASTRIIKKLKESPHREFSIIKRDNNEIILNYFDDFYELDENSKFKPFSGGKSLISQLEETENACKELENKIGELEEKINELEENNEDENEDADQETRSMY